MRFRLKLLRKLWCVLRLHRRVALFTRWTPCADGTFERHCARCEDGWSWPQSFGVVDVVDMPGSAAPPKHYSGPVEVVDGKWRPLQVGSSL